MRGGDGGTLLDAVFPFSKVAQCFPQFQRVADVDDLLAFPQHVAGADENLTVADSHYHRFLNFFTSAETR